MNVLRRRLFVLLAAAVLAGLVALGAYAATIPVASCIRSAAWASHPILLWGTVGSDAIIWAAYTAIPISLLLLWRARRDVPASPGLICVAAFVVLCGWTHLLGIVTTWWPVYYLALFMKGLTAAVSVATALLIPLLYVPILRSLPSHAQLEEALAAAKAAQFSAEVNLSGADAARRFAEEQRLLADQMRDELAGANAQLREQAEELRRARDSARRMATEATVEAEQKGAQVVGLEQALATIQRQREAIDALSTPILPLADGVLLLPLVGVLDSARAADVTDNLLREINQRRAASVIIDLAGLQALDTAVAAAILRLVSAIALLGARAIITGIRPDVSQTIVSLGIDLSAIATRQTLADGLALSVKWREKRLAR